MGMIFVIGSGPAAAACLTGLASRGLRATVIDAGIGLEPERARILESYRETGDQESLLTLKEGMSASTKGIPLKLSFGSDFPYRKASESLLITENGSGMLPSFALGGLSNVWGAAMLPYRQPDIADWPIKASDLEPHYRAVTQLTRLAFSSSGTMDAVFPAYCDHPEELRLSSQGASLWTDLQASAGKLQRSGLLFGRGRVAVRGSAPSGEGGCDYKGLCMYGCPHGHIYNSRETILDLERRGLVDYRPGLVVRKLTETPQGLEIECRSLTTGEPIKFSGAKVFLAAGVISSARILMESLAMRQRRFVMRDSQYFLLPLLRFHGVKGASSEGTNTLSQIFLELVEGSGLPRSSHLQVYGYNDMVGEALRASLGMAGRLTPGLLRFLEERMLIMQGYLHSDLSGTIEAWLEEKDSTSIAPMHLRAIRNPSTAKHVHQVVRKLLKQSMRLKAVPILPMLQIALPGRGFHTGGSIPMRKNPGALETDTLGRPQGFRNLHVVDASVLPSIPSTTITFSVMANAHRIASECDLPERSCLQ